MKNKNTLENLFNPKSIAIVGATEKVGKVGNVITKNILDLGYAGEVYLVNPSYTTLFGRVCFPDLKSIPDKIDLAIIVVPAKAVYGAIENAAEKVKNYVIISAGFSEIGEMGLKREAELILLARKHNLKILGPNCLGFIVPKLKLNASFAGGMPEVGKIALVSQSGALAVAFMDIARREIIGFSKIVSVGNKMQLDESAMLEYLAEDSETQVIGLYLEGIKYGKRFLQAAAEVAKSKPIVLLKAGKTEKSQKAIASHTGALAGSDEIISAVCRRAGIIRADNLENFLDLLKIFSCYRKMAGDKVIAVTNAGGPGVLATDAFKDKSIKLADISESTKKLLQKNLPEESSFANPIDMLGDADEVRYRETLESIAGDTPDATIAILTPQDQTPVDKIADEIIAYQKKNQSVVAASFVGGLRIDQGVEKMARAGIPNFPFPERAVSMLDHLYSRAEIIPDSGERAELKNLDTIKKIIADAKKEDREALYFNEASDVMDQIDVPVIESVIIRDDKDLKKINKFPVVIKVDSDQVLHKTDQGGLVLDIPDAEKLREAWIKMKSVFLGERIIVQPMVNRKIELIIGMKRDEVFGPVVVVGLGGIYTEVFKTVDFFLPPGGIKYAEEWLKASRIGFLFKGARGEYYDAKSVARIIAGIGELSLETEKIISLDINPLLIYNDDRKPLAVDVKVLV